MRYSHEELVEGYLRDLTLDAEDAERDAANGRDDADWTTYAAKCRAEIARIKSASVVRIDKYGVPYPSEPLA